MSRNEEENLTLIRERWFPDHKAAYHGPFDLGIHKDVEYLTWRKEGTICYFVEYWAVFNRLIVSGDIGDAIYAWSDKISLAWVAGCHPHYIHGKCVASEKGRGCDWYDWDRDAVDDAIREAALEEGLSPDDEAVREAMDWTSCKQEWTRYLTTFDSAEKLFGCDAWERAGEGDVLPLRLLGHVEGLKMALTQLGKLEKKP
jgi:hypothetical protein